MSELSQSISKPLANQKPFRLHLVAGVLVVLAFTSFLSILLYDKSQASTNEAVVPNGDLFSYTHEVIKPRLTEIDLQKRLSSYFGSHVYVAPVDGSGLYIAIVNGNIYYTESSGQVLVQGDVYSLDRSEYLSERFESELRYSSDLVAARKASKRPFSQMTRMEPSHSATLVSNHDIKDLEPRQSDETYSAVNISTPAKPSAIVSNDSQPSSPPQVSGMKGALSPFLSLETQASGASTAKDGALSVDPTLLAVARSLSPSDPKFSSSCLQLVEGTKDISELSSLFSQIPKENGAQEQCGMTFAQRALPTFKDDDLITYKALGEEKAVINIMSDYTCSFCARFHRRVPSLNAEGITVRVFPYGRIDYFTESGQPNIFANNFAAALCVPPTERTKVFDDLLLNFRTYSKTAYPSIEPSAECLTRAIAYKIVGNIFNTQHQTPLIFYSNGQNQIGDSLTSVDAIVKRALSI
ncbi:hypothetical protein KW429_11025 [Vibrio fluvialis]|nr:hypothetical protein [Vibrio fluvialis]MBY7902385.1 hypothetical protein [Vibrio fluvialis]